MGIVLPLLAAVVGVVVGYLARRYWAASRLGDVEEKIKRNLAEAEAKAKEIVVEAKDKAASLLVDIKSEEKERRKELETLDGRLTRKEETLEKRFRRCSRARRKGKDGGGGACEEGNGD